MDMKRNHTMFGECGNPCAPTTYAALSVIFTTAATTTLWGFSLFFPSEASPYAHPAEAAGAETRIFSQRQFNSKKILP